MAYDIGPKIGIEGEAQFRSAIRNISTQLKTLDTEMKAVSSAYDSNDKSSKKLTSQNKILNEQISKQKEKLDQLKSGLSSSSEKYGENDEKTLKWKQSVNNATTSLNKMERQLEDNNEQLKNGSREGLNFGESLNKVGAAAKRGIATIGKTIVGAVSVAAVGFAAIAKSAIEGYAEYEQLVGGVETLFKDSSGIITKYANDAYKTAGLSANEYMATVTSFSASLLQSLGGDTKKAAKYADTAIIDMSDNANKMGTSMEMLQNAYQGFAKQNYTMLDNLKLGYGGTKKEMQRLLDDAEKISGIKYDISSFADITQAIHVMQTEMGITGTTAEEASSTIQGSISSMKSAWTNFVTGMADDTQDFDTLLNNLIDSFLAVASNLMPRIVELLPRLVEGITQLTQELIPYLPEMISQMLPSIIDGAKAIVNGLIQALPEILGSLGEAFEENQSIISDVFYALEDIVNFIIDNSETIIAIIAGIGAGMLAWNVVTTIQGVIGAIQAWKAVTEGMTISQKILNLVMAANPIGIIITIIAALVAAIIVLWNTNDDFREALSGFFKDVGQWFSNLWTAISEFFVNLWTTISEWFSNTINSITTWFSNLISSVTGWFSNLWSSITGWFSNLWASISGWLSTTLSNIGTWFSDLWGSMTGWLSDLWSNVSNWFTGLWDKLVGIGENIINGIWQGLKNAWESVKTWFNNVWDNLFGNKTANVNINATGNLDGSNKNGLDYVPFDGYVSELHKGEMVVPAKFAKMLRKIGSGVSTNFRTSSIGGTGGDGRITESPIVQNLSVYSPTPLAPSQVARESKNALRRLAWAK